MGTNNVNADNFADPSRETSYLSTLYNSSRNNRFGNINGSSTKKTSGVEIN